MDMMARRRAMMLARQASSGRLPSGFTEYEYIEATGTQYINTGYIPTADTEIVCTFMRTASQSYHAAEFGVSPTPKAIAAGDYWGWGNAADKQGTYHPDDIFGLLTIRVNISGVYNLIGAKAVNFGTVTWTSGSLPIYLLARNNGGNADRLAKEKLYHWAAYENGTKMVEFIPALRRSDNELGLYETVSGTFFTNAGSGVFTGAALA